jgi:phosphoglycolate phosphatase
MTGRAVPAVWDGRPLHAVLFDLDGTLLDTAADIALALNRALTDRGIANLPGAQVRKMIGKGAPVLMSRALAANGLAPDDALHAVLLDRFFHHYGRLHEHAGESTAEPYPGAAEGLAALREAGLKIAVVTNKQQSFAIALLQRLGLSEDIDLVVGGDTCDRRKPDPQPLQFACETLDVEVTAALMVGDSVNDVLAARAAGMPVLCVPYGYNEGEDPRTLPCDGFVETLAELPGLLYGRSGARTMKAMA